MTQRDAILVLAAIVVASAVATILLIGSVAASNATSRTPTVVFQGRPGFSPGATQIAATGRQFEQRFERGLPEAIRPIAPLERGVADASREAAGYLLVLLAVSATTVLARAQVVSAYRASLGDWRTQARTFGTGLAVIALALSATFLVSVVFLGTLTGGTRPAFAGPPFGAFTFQLGLQAGFVVLSVLLVLVTLPALIGFAAAAWRLGDLVLSVRGLRRWAAQVPAPLVALGGASILFVLSQLPYVGIAIGVAALAYALGAFVSAWLDPGTASARL